MTNKKMQHWDKMYALPPENIPWEIIDPPKELVELIDNGTLKGGQALDIACGTGNYSFYLAKHGFKVIGVDFSQKALAIAAARNNNLSLPVSFKHADVTKLAKTLSDETFDFILDYSILHHIAPNDVAGYAKQFRKYLNPHGKLLLVCYSDKDDYSHGQNKATGKYGNDMFYRTRPEIEELYRDLKELSYQEARLGKRAQHFAHSFLFERS